MNRSGDAQGETFVAALPQRGLLFGLGGVGDVRRGGDVPTGGELTLIEAVGRAGPDFLVFCRSSPVGDLWRDLIDAWQCLQQAVSASCPSLSR